LADAPKSELDEASFMRLRSLPAEVEPPGIRCVWFSLIWTPIQKYTQ
jgi:hypothetical protein